MNHVSLINHLVFLAPQLLLLTFVVLALLTQLFVPKRGRQLPYLIVQLGLILTMALTINHFTQPPVSIDNLFVADNFAFTLQVFIYLSGFVAFLYGRAYVAENKMPTGEYYILGGLSLLGMSMLVSAGSLLMVYLGLELMSLPLYAMVALKRDSVQPVEAAMKYFIMGAIASGMLLYGMSLYFGATGQLALTAITKYLANAPQGQEHLFYFGLMFMLVGIGFKLAATPFHMWAPDVYSGAPTSVTLFLSTAPKLAAFGMLYRVLVEGALPLGSIWQQILLFMAIFSIGLGNLFAIAQSNIKRMLAYSGIAHIGYMLLGFAAGSPEGYRAALFYIICYALMSLASFGALVVLSHRGMDLDKIESLSGLNKQNPWLAALLLITLFSLAGVPPTVGFFAKLFVLQALINTGNILLATVALIFAIVGAFYYIRVIRVMYFDEPIDKTPLTIARFDMAIVLSVNSFMLLILGIFPGVLLRLVTISL